MFSPATTEGPSTLKNSLASRHRCTVGLLPGGVLGRAFLVDRRTGSWGSRVMCLLRVGRVARSAVPAMGYVHLYVCLLRHDSFGRVEVHVVVVMPSDRSFDLVGRLIEQPVFPVSQWQSFPQGRTERTGYRRRGMSQPSEGDRGTISEVSWGGGR